MKVAVCDYRAGNIRSVEIAMRRLGAELVEDVAGADLAVLPGVGSARSAMAELRRQGLDEVLRARVRDGRAVLGICLGLQLSLDWSEEDGGVEGLGILQGRSIRLTEGRVPRMGWATLEGARDVDVHLHHTDMSPAVAYYFAHSYAAETSYATAWSEGIVAEVRSGSFLGVQFHPEKSGAAGARYLDRVMAEVRERFLSRA
ncbi:MAG TPA: imidazole glycerol phosphate synthase subunit HisH [Gaiellaceae bacterium]|nr:imidazole glycerol phosphate synthase subunit HisH [Gaiellaceae bacterium]